MTLSTPARRIDELITRGEEIRTEVSRGGEAVESGQRATEVYRIDKASFELWKLDCLSLFNDVLPEESPRKPFLLERLNTLEAETGAREFLLHQLRELQTEELEEA